jgi:hypothetical protein
MNEDEEKDTRPRRAITSGRPRQSSSGNSGKMEKGESVLDFLSR